MGEMGVLRRPAAPIQAMERSAGPSASAFVTMATSKDDRSRAYSNCCSESGGYLRFLSSQLNTRRSLRPIPFGSQCRSAPSDAENGTSVFGHFKRS